MSRMLIDLRGLTIQQYQSLGCKGMYYETYCQEDGRPFDEYGRSVFDVIDKKYVVRT